MVFPMERQSAEKPGELSAAPQRGGRCEFKYRSGWLRIQPQEALRGRCRILLVKLELLRQVIE